MTAVIRTPRLELISLSAAFLRASLAGAPPSSFRLPPAWPKGHESILQRRLTQLEADPTHQPWLLRGISLPSEDPAREVRNSPPGEGGPALIGLIGFHAPPDPTGMVEIGYRIEPPYRGHGYATEAVEALLSWARRCQKVKRFRASVRPDNQPSLHIIHKLGFSQTGQQWDEIDGLELVFERATALTARPYTPADTC